MLNPQAARMRTAARRPPPCLQILMHGTAEPEVPTFLVPMNTHNILSTTTFERPRHYFGMLKIVCEQNKKYVFSSFVILTKTNSHLTNAFFMFSLLFLFFANAIIDAFPFEIRV